jgi:four helix bundle protein
VNHRGIESLEPHEYAGSLKKADELRHRTKTFAIRIVNLFRSLPRSPDAQTLGKQILRSGTSVAANYRAVCRARSKAEFISKMGIVVEEADEAVFWLEILTETGVVRAERAADLQKEANELLAIFSASLRTAKRGRQ